MTSIETERKIWSCEPLKLRIEHPVPKDIEISRSIQGKTIDVLCREIGITKYEPYGRFKAKIHEKVEVVDPATRGNYVIVTALTPTSLGEGKSTTTIGLAQALTAHLNLNAFACIRQPSQGPTFGLKGGAAGGGYSQVWPMDEFNLHLTGDIHAVTAANNLIAAALDARMFHEATQSDTDLFRRLVQKPGVKGEFFTEAQKRRVKRLGISTEKAPNDLSEDEKRLFARLDFDPDSITVSRVVDTNDRFLRRITIGQAPTEKNFTRQSKFTISVASELMAILALAKDLSDVCSRVERMVIGFSRDSKPITCDDLCISGAVCALLKEAIYPTLIQTLEGSPVLVHCGPFANVAHGNSSIIADRLALDLVGREGFVVTEAGFGSDIGFEKFMDIKCRHSKLMPDCAVLVVTARAIKAHGKDLMGDQEIGDSEALQEGLVNMVAHIRNILDNFNTPVVVAMNRFSGDTDIELETIRKYSILAGASDCQVANNWALGGKGAVDLASSVVKICSKSRGSGFDQQQARKPKLLYLDEEKLSIEEKIRRIATRVYGAADISILEATQSKIRNLEANGFGHLPVCIAKTQLSISHDPKLKGAPKGYIFPIVDVEVSAGAGFVYALAAETSTMPGLPTRPSYFDISIDPETGKVDGLF